MSPDVYRSSHHARQRVALPFAVAALAIATLMAVIWIAIDNEEGRLAVVGQLALFLVMCCACGVILYFRSRASQTKQ